MLTTQYVRNGIRLSNLASPFHASPLDPVTIRKISGGPRSEDGRRSRDPFLFLKKICQKNAISFSTYLGDRLGIAANSVDRLSDIIRCRVTNV